MKTLSPPVLLVTGIAVGLTGVVNLSSQEAASPGPLKTNIPYSDAKPILHALREDLWPAELKAKTPAELEGMWPDWVSRRDAMIRARVEQGDEDSIIHFLLFGTTFTKRPRATEGDLAALAVRPAEVLSSFRARIEDFVAAVAAPGTNERLQFARQVIERKGIDPTTEAGKSQMRRYLEQRARTVGATGAVRSSTLLVPVAEVRDKLTLFRDRGLSSDTSILIDVAIEQALEAIKAKGLIDPGTVRRVAIVGPGLDFTDKLDGYDFYAEQTIQPFAIIDSLIRLGLGHPAELQVTAFDLSPRVLQHLEAARARARAGSSYALVLPRNLDRPWTANLVQDWERFGDRIGEETTAVAPPPSAGRVQVRSVLVRPSVVLSTRPQDLNIILQRLEPVSARNQFDLIVATNILIYYDVFEQSLAVANIAKLLRPGGFFLSNNRIFELPAAPVGPVGYTDVIYMKLPGVGETGDRIVWYQRQ
jgi:SAM-dependent methyltransferase